MAAETESPHEQVLNFAGRRQGPDFGGSGSNVCPLCIVSGHRSHFSGTGAVARRAEAKDAAEEGWPARGNIWGLFSPAARSSICCSLRRPSPDPGLDFGLAGPMGNENAVQIAI